ncbi:MAG: mechanosensitive ion channel family protein [Acidobacteriia bacterium]|nr:mechanosensitive ion channel family protein [Terriglobia bacterium]
MAAIRHILLSDPMQLAGPAVVFAITLIAGWVVRAMIMRALRAWASRTDGRAGQILVQTLRGPLAIWTVILAMHLAIQFSDLPAAVTTWGANTLFVLWIFSLTIVSMRAVGNLVRIYGVQIPGALPVTTLTQNLAQIAVVILWALVALAHFHVSITPILTALGVGGLAVALALQDTLSNLFGGFYVAMAGQVRLGDYIRLNTGEEGYVADIGWRSTTIRALANNTIIVPNAKLAQAIVTNYYLPEKRMSASVQVGVSYECDPDRIERILVEIGKQGAGEIPGMLADPVPSAAFDPGFGDSALNFTLNYQVAEFANQFGVRHELRKRILRRFREEGIAIPFPTRTVHLDGPKPEV